MRDYYGGRHAPQVVAEVAAGGRARLAVAGAVVHARLRGYAVEVGELPERAVGDAPVFFGDPRVCVRCRRVAGVDCLLEGTPTSIVNDYQISL